MGNGRYQHGRISPQHFTVCFGLVVGNGRCSTHMAILNPSKYPLLPEWRTAVLDTAVFPPNILPSGWFGGGKRPLRGRTGCG
ncbi:MAG: hypothetical protein IPJ90_17940 [Anaerolineaceae bacterium]|nr:hypothetical protein [Anaerolineaceae bacterium]